MFEMTHEVGPMSIQSIVKNFIRDEEGASAIEYALLAAMVAVVVATFVSPVSAVIRSTFASILSGLGG